ncbi:MAG: hypothetical protein DCC49_12695 [Acidobacteria bacterium]|nr:MAG: hypothetical protein DCC49_12695 [Acidobacteriota bacterium]
MDVRVEEIPAYTVAATKARSVKAEDIGAAWGKLIGWLGSARATAETEVGAGIGITEGKPGARGQKYEAAWPVESGTKGDRTVRIKETPPGTYAIGRYEGNPAGVNEALRELVEEWLPGSGHELGKGPMLSLHRSGLLDDVQVIDVCIPIDG